MAIQKAIVVAVVVVVVVVVVVEVEKPLVRIFGRKNESLTGGWSKLHNKEHKPYLLPPIIIRNIELSVGETRSTRREELRATYNTVVEKFPWKTLKCISRRCHLQEQIKRDK